MWLYMHEGVAVAGVIFQDLHRLVIKAIVLGLSRCYIVSFCMECLSIPPTCA